MAGVGRINTEITYTGIMAEVANIQSGSRREGRFFNKVIKPAFVTGMKDWHKKLYPLRFKTDKYRLKRRKKKYNETKRRVLGHDQPLVGFSRKGQKLRDLTVGPSKANIVAQRKRNEGIVTGQVKLRGARKVNQMHRAKREQIRRELYLLLPSDFAFLDNIIRENVVKNWAQMSRPLRSRKKIR